MAKFNYMQTFTGLKFFPARPELWHDSIVIEDIAHALSNTCRFNGHCAEFYSVAEHCVRGAGVLMPNKPAAYAFLLHDATEAYYSDVPSPLKQYMPEYQMAEAALTNHIWKLFNISSDADTIELVKEADLRMLVSEAERLMNRDVTGTPWWEEPHMPPPYPTVFSDVSLRAWRKFSPERSIRLDHGRGTMHPTFARDVFLELYRALKP